MMMDIRNYAESQAAEAEKLLKELVVIPAPCGKENRKAAYCKEWLESRGALDVYVDEAGNVVYPYEVQHRDRLLVVMAHIDIPFAEEDKLVITQKGDQLEGPGCGETANLAALLLAAAFFACKKPDLQTGLLFVASTGARGKGDLYGARRILADYEGRIGAMITLQGYLGQCVNRFPGMLRYQVKVKRKWEADADRRMGSVYGSAGRDNPILILSQLACTLQQMQIPKGHASRHQISQFQGGYSPDLLAEEASLVYEMTSLDEDCLKLMKEQALATLHALEEKGSEVEVSVLEEKGTEGEVSVLEEKGTEGEVSVLEEKGIEVEVSVLAERPCQRDEALRQGQQQAMENLLIPLLQEYSEGREELLVADTEANLARAAGIAALTLGCIQGRRPDSAYERVSIHSQRAGLGLLLESLYKVCQLLSDSLKDGLSREVFRIPDVVYHRDGLVLRGHELLQVLDRHREELLLPSYVHTLAPYAFRGMEHLVLKILDRNQVADLAPVLAGKQMRLELGLTEAERIVLPFTNIGGFSEVFSCDGQIDFQAYDARFPRIQDKNLQMEIAISRLLYPVGLEAAARSRYEQHVRKRFRPSMLRLLTGEWHHYGQAPQRMTELLKLKTMDRFLRQELLTQAADYGTLSDVTQEAAGESGQVDYALLISHKQPALLTSAKLLEEAGIIGLHQSLRAYAHCLFHYVYGHPWWAEHDPRWKLACDIAANYLTDQLLGPELLCLGLEETLGLEEMLGLEVEPELEDERKQEKNQNTEADLRLEEKQRMKGNLSRTALLDYLQRKSVYDWLQLEEPVLTAERIFELLTKKIQAEPQTINLTDQMAVWAKLMEVDVHAQWPGSSFSGAGLVDLAFLSGKERKLQQDLEAAMKALFQDGAGMGQKQQLLQGKAGSKAGSREEEAGLRKREGQDYQQFLQQFMVCKEDRILDLDSYDPVYYTYGLTHYEDMPLVEPLETKEVNRLEELVIVIDTSGSCQGELVRFFLEETWSVFGHAENFFDQFHVRILQCDCVVQEDVKLTNLREVEEYMKHLVIRGGGGTDFRPAFAHIRELRRKGELRHLKGILYFTDGQGVYPAQAPDCETAFIFLEGRYESIKVPYWVKTLILPLPKDGSLKLEYSGEFRI